jgi:hypothetical protein
MGWAWPCGDAWHKQVGFGVKDLPYQTVKTLLAEAAQASGHSAEIADALAQSAWWLENRGLGGVAQVTAYLDATQTMRPAELGARRDDYGALRCICPITAAAAVMAEREAAVAEEGEAAPVDYGLFGGPASPLIMGAMLAFYGDEQGLAVRLRFDGQQVVLAKDFACIEVGDAAALARVDATAAEPTDVEFLPLQGFRPEGQVLAYAKRLTLQVPATRLGDNGQMTLM